MVMIRKASIDDVEVIDAIEKKVFDTACYDLTSKMQYRYLLTKGNAEIWLAEHCGTICGAIVLFFKRNSAWGRLYSIAVLPEFQGKEIGKNLFEQAEHRIKQRRLKGMTLEVRKDNRKHIERYTKLGYQPYYEVVDYYPDGESCLKMKKLFST